MKDMRVAKYGGTKNPAAHATGVVEKEAEEGAEAQRLKREEDGSKRPRTGKQWKERSRQLNRLWRS